MGSRGQVEGQIVVRGGFSLHAFPLGKVITGQSESPTFYEMGMGGWAGEGAGAVVRAADQLQFSAVVSPMQ
jgi:hypothetical protein